MRLESTFRTLCLTAAGLWCASSGCGSAAPESLVCTAAEKCDVSGVSGEVKCEGQAACVEPITCDGDCRILCTGGGSCAGGVVCGSGKCEVQCIGPSSCSSVDCRNASSCFIDCAGGNSCDGKLSCGTGFCDINCGMANNNGGMCSEPIDCSNSCGCQVQCDLLKDACRGGVTCRGGCEQDFGCSGFSGCNTCQD